VIYGILDNTGLLIKNITRKLLKTSTKYNTYTLAGLPFGPISNPGTASLKAVVLPSRSDFLYFVSRNDGTHYFSKTYEEHNEAVRKFQLSRKARKGKSWRDLGKRKNN